MSRVTQGTQSDVQKSETGEVRPSYFAPDLLIRGRVSCDGELFVAGRVEGELDCVTLSVNKGGAIDGVVRVQRLNLEAASSLTGEIRADVMGVQGEARVHARVICQGSHKREAAMDASARSDASRSKRLALSGPIPAE